VKTVGISLVIISQNQKAGFKKHYSVGILNLFMFRELFCTFNCSAFTFPQVSPAVLAFCSFADVLKSCLPVAESSENRLLFFSVF